MSDESLSDIFGSGNIPSRCSSFKTTHCCNIFCEYFKIYGNFDPMDEDLSIAMSISRSDFPVPSTKGKRKAEEEPEDSRSGSRRRAET
ncbi:hypothetical protein R3P38DRAFT_3220826 [Favolaschia claudopus]|uniref:Uncharacterized protein n=1 Tax=Favolaschia claudopus TaxID=2862362 RepID=A0AAW0A1P2_9AGAR